jgi:Helicase associated domain
LHGHTSVPREYHLDPRLGRWTHNQREMFAKGKGPREDRLEKLNSIQFDWSGEQGKLSNDAPPGTETMAVGATPPNEVDVLMRAAQARDSPLQPHPKPAPTPVITWGRANPQQTKTQSGVTQMAVRLEMERSKLDAENRQLKKSSQKLQAMNDTLAKRLADAEAGLKLQTQELNERLQFYDEQFRAQQEMLEAHAHQLAGVGQNGNDRYEEQLREQSQTIQSQGNQLSQLAQQIQDMRQVQYNLQHQVGLQNLSYRL